jgi:hypothetical protein
VNEQGEQAGPAEGRQVGGFVALTRLVNRAREDKDFFHDLVFNTEAVLDQVDYLDRRVKGALISLSPEEALSALLRPTALRRQECEPSCALSCDFTCGSLSCKITCGSDAGSCGHTCGASCGDTLQILART